MTRVLHRLAALCLVTVVLTTASIARAQAPDTLRAKACVDSARAAASADHHRDAIRWYHRAMALDSSLTSNLAMELGHQYTWADAPDSAVACYRLYLASHPENVEAELGLARALSWSNHYDEAVATYGAVIARGGEGSTEARLGIARVTAWKDDHAAALAEYDAILREDSTNLDARLGQAQVVNWSGRHREAAALYDSILVDHPDNADAREGLATAQYWMGRTDLARETLRAGTPATSTGTLANDIDRSVAPDGSYTYEQNKDSDDIKRRISTLEAGVHVDDLTRVGGVYGHARIEQPGRPDVTRNSIAAVLQRRFSESLAVSAALGYQWNSFDRSALGPQTYWKDDFNLLTIDAYATLTPRDWWRWDFGLFHGSLTNPDAIFRGIALTELSAGLDWRLRSNLLSASSFAVSFYNDDNRRIDLGQRMVWQPLWRIPVRVNHRFTSTTGVGYFGFSETNDHGYYDPRQYLSLYEEVAVDVKFSKRVKARVSGRIGLDRENGDDWFDVERFEAYATIAVHRRFDFTAGYYNSTSRLDSREGYAADGFHLSLDYVHHD